MRDLQFDRYAVSVSDALNGDNFRLRAQIQKNNICLRRVFDDRLNYLGIRFAADFPTHIGKTASRDNMVIVLFFADKSSLSLFLNQNPFIT